MSWRNSVLNTFGLGQNNEDEENPPYTIRITNTRFTLGASPPIPTPDLPWKPSPATPTLTPQQQKAQLEQEELEEQQRLLEQIRIQEEETDRCLIEERNHCNQEEQEQLRLAREYRETYEASRQPIRVNLDAYTSHSSSPTISPRRQHRAPRNRPFPRSPSRSNEAGPSHTQLPVKTTPQIIEETSPLITLTTEAKQILQLIKNLTLPEINNQTPTPLPEVNLPLINLGNIVNMVITQDVTAAIGQLVAVLNIQLQP
ncbi:11240_t:CDS:2 [Diversispora eburnea]|uniref:11240_t:CDS:1 n=1 Tax=Diversispora eburnea TaxID=1213867 RepID=A0A9N9FZZ2_9GLOM|nr:11240_t:CDS:2 [Diversispora eburnea]